MADELRLSQQAISHWVNGAEIPLDALNQLRALGYDGPAEQREEAAEPLTPADLVEFRGWITAKFEAIEKRLAEVNAAAHEEREALAEMIRALYPEAQRPGKPR